MVRLEDLVAKTRPARTRVNSGNPLCGIPTPQGKDTQLKPLRGLVELRLNQRPVTESPSPNPRHRIPVTEMGHLLASPFSWLAHEELLTARQLPRKRFSLRVASRLLLPPRQVAAAGLAHCSRVTCPAIPQRRDRRATRHRRRWPRGRHRESRNRVRKSRCPMRCGMLQPTRRCAKIGAPAPRQVADLTGCRG